MFPHETKHSPSPTGVSCLTLLFMEWWNEELPCVGVVHVLSVFSNTHPKLLDHFIISIFFSMSPVHFRKLDLGDQKLISYHLL